MKSKILPLENVATVLTAVEALTNRASGAPGLMLVQGPPGVGKTKAIELICTRVHGVMVRACEGWKPSALLAALLAELDRTGRGGLAQMRGELVNALVASRRPIFVDEGDYIAPKPALLNTLRDLHDLSGAPVVLVGMAELNKKLAHQVQFTSRIFDTVELIPIAIGDARTMADQLAEVKVADDLLERVHLRAAGNARLIFVGLMRIERQAKTAGLTTVSSADWGRADRFFTGEPPQLGSSRVTSIARA